MKRACYFNVYKNTCALLFKANNVKVLTTDINIRSYKYQFRNIITKQFATATLHLGDIIRSHRKMSTFVITMNYEVSKGKYFS